MEIIDLELGDKINLSDIVNEAIKEYYKNIRSKEEQNNGTEPAEGQTKIDC